MLAFGAAQPLLASWRHQARSGWNGLRHGLAWFLWVDVGLASVCAGAVCLMCVPQLSLLVVGQAQL